LTLFKNSEWYFKVLDNKDWKGILNSYSQLQAIIKSLNKQFYTIKKED
jgi:hypothetical protein